MVESLAAVGAYGLSSRCDFYRCHSMSGLGGTLENLRVAHAYIFYTRNTAGTRSRGLVSDVFPDLLILLIVVFFFFFLLLFFFFFVHFCFFSASFYRALNRTFPRRPTRFTFQTPRIWLFVDVKPLGTRLLPAWMDTIPTLPLPTSESTGSINIIIDIIIITITSIITIIVFVMPQTKPIVSCRNVFSQ